MIAKVTHAERVMQGCGALEGILKVFLAYAYGYKTTVQKSAQHSGSYFHYTYDSNGNRLTETTQAGTKTSVYDAANRLTGVGYGKSMQAG